MKARTIKDLCGGVSMTKDLEKLKADLTGKDVGSLLGG